MFNWWLWPYIYNFLNRLLFNIQRRIIEMSKFDLAIAVIIILLFQTGISILISKRIIAHIEKHSVHPEYGNYKKVNSKGFTCDPWDACP